LRNHICALPRYPRDLVLTKYLSDGYYLFPSTLRETVARNGDENRRPVARHLPATRIARHAGSINVLEQGLLA
jgi:hypothetical protein